MTQHARQMFLVRIDTQVISKRRRFKYLGVVIRVMVRSTRMLHAVLERDGQNRGLHLVSGHLCDKNVPPRLVGTFYKVAVRQVMLYGAEYWPVKNSHVQK